MQRTQTPVAPASFQGIDRAPDSAPPWPSGHLLAALVLFGLVGALRVAHAIGSREVFGFEATTALLALLWWPFVARDLLAPRVRRWRARRRERATMTGPAGASPPTSAGETPTATVIRIADRRRPR